MITSNSNDSNINLPELILNETNAAILVTDSHNKIIYINAGFTRLFGFDTQEALNQYPNTLLAGTYTHRHIQERIFLHVAKGKEFTEEVLLYNKDKEALWVSAVIKPLYNSKGELHYVISTLTDINDAQLYQSIQHKVLEAIAQNMSHEDIMDLLCKQVESMVPDATPAILKLTKDKTLTLLSCGEKVLPLIKKHQPTKIGPNVGTAGTAAWRGAAVLTTNAQKAESWEYFRQESVELNIITCWAIPIKSHEDKVLGTFSLYYPVETKPTPFHQRLISICAALCALTLAREDYKNHIHELAFFDTLTGLPNRFQLQQKLKNIIENNKRAHRHTNDIKHEIAILFLDIDNFKHINDSLGHIAGDKLIKKVAERLRTQLDSTSFIGRLGGDEFVIIMNRSGVIEAEHLAQQIIASMRDLFFINKKPIKLSTSLGISLYPGDGFTQEGLLRRADIAMYKAKSTGKNRYCFFTPEMDTQIQEALSIETALRSTLDQHTHHLSLFYQPQINLKTHKLAGVEALLRWNDPVLGQVTPDRFIPLAEEFELIDNLGRWALKEACNAFSEWRQQGIAPPHISVNLSPIQLQRSDLCDFISRLLKESRLAPHQLRLEITEGVMMDKRYETQQNIEALKELGITLAVDDFGTGYASIGYFRTMPIVELKVDKSFTQDIAKDSTTQSLVVAIIRLTEKLNINIVAEGIETQEQFEFLQDNKCDIGQGYYIAPPLSSFEIQHWFKNHQENGFKPYHLSNK